MSQSRKFWRKFIFGKKSLDVAFRFRESILPPATVTSKPNNDNNVVDIKRNIQTFISKYEYSPKFA
jgi:hypothetical protein